LLRPWCPYRNGRTPTAPHAAPGVKVTNWRRDLSKYVIANANNCQSKC
jgi:hypothetical protein